MRALGFRLHKPKPNEWIRVEWAIVEADARTVFDFGQILAPRTFSEALALRHIHEAVAATVQQCSVKKALVWEIEGNAQIKIATRPRLRAEGVICAAAALSGSVVDLVAWATIQSCSGTRESKDALAKAKEVCGVEVGAADSYAVLVAVAALRR